MLTAELMAACIEGAFQLMENDPRCLTRYRVLDMHALKDNGPLPMQIYTMPRILSRAIYCFQRFV